MAHPIPAAALDDRLAFVGTAGAGKTYAAMGGVELLLASGARVVLIDPLDVTWGLRLMFDGQIPSPFPIVIFGGAHADLPINEHAGALVGEAVATMRESCIVSLGSIGTKAGERRFMLGFLTALYRHASGEPVHVVIDEADMFAPQRLMDKEGEAAKLLGQMETIVRRGRVKGFIPWLITQRPAVLSKDVLSQADGLIALKLTASQDREAIGAWIEGQADRAEGKAILASLPTMQRGQGVVWVPGRGILETATFPAKITFDSSRTPKRGETVRNAELQPLDLGALKERLATVEADIAANDPRALKAEILRLTKLASTPGDAAIETARIDGHAAGYAAGLAEGEARGNAAGHALALTRVRNAIDKIVVAEPAEPQEAPRTAAPVPPSKDTAPRRPASVAPAPAPARSQQTSGALGLVTAAARVHPVRLTWGQIATLAGRKPRGGHFNASRKTALDEGWLIEDGGLVRVSDEGLHAAGAWPPRAAGGLAEVWAEALPQPANKMFAVLRERSLTVEALADTLGMQPRGGHWNNGIATLRRNGLIEDRAGRLQLTEIAT